MWQLFKGTPKECIGIDIGTSLIKIAEIGKKGKDKELRNYGEIKVGEVFPDLRRSVVEAESEAMADLINNILQEAKIKIKTAVISLPDYHSFFTTFSLPAMSEEEIPEAVRYEAPLHIPLPLSRVALDWQVVEGLGEKEAKSLKILLAAVPTEIVQKYQEIASLAGLKLTALEAEVFGMMRSLVKTDEITALMEIGAESTTCSIVERKTLKISHSFEVGGRKLTQCLAADLDLEKQEAEDLKIKNGILGDERAKESLMPALDEILAEAETAFDGFSRQEGKKAQNLILSGGTVLLPGLKDYFSQKLGMKTEIGDPFSGLISPPILSETLEKMKPFYAIAVGVALRELK